MASCYLFRLLLSATAFWAATCFDINNNETTSCDDILRFAFPDLCELEVFRGNVEVRGLRLAYWRYRAAGGAAHETKAPVLTVHGGPAFTHNYLLPLKQLACRGHEVVFYDQVGCGESSVPSHPRETAPWLFTIDYYIEEVRALLKELGWSTFHFIGHSWGTIVGQVFGFTQDPRLLSLILIGPLSDAQLYIKSQWDQHDGSLGSLPSYMQNAIKEMNDRKEYSSPLYEREASHLTTLFTARTVPTPDCLAKSSQGMEHEATKEIYVGMQGASEFTIGGVLEHMNLTGQLWTIKKPVLLLRAEFDTMRPPCVNALYDALPHAWLAVIPRAGHCSMLDEPKLVNDVAGGFFDRVEDRRLVNFQGWIEGVTGQAPGKTEEEALASKLPALIGEVHMDRYATLWMLLPCVLCTMLGVLVGVTLGPFNALARCEGRGKCREWRQARPPHQRAQPFLGS